MVHLIFFFLELLHALLKNLNLFTSTPAQRDKPIVLEVVCPIFHHKIVIFFIFIYVDYPMLFF